jgi:tRNA (cytidine/uridine-2'-O-)-methyltransferase
MGFRLDDTKMKRCGLDYWDLLDVTFYDGLDDFFAKNEGPFYYFTTKGLSRHSDVSYPDGCYLVFGREDAGLPEELLFQNPDTPSLFVSPRRCAASTLDSVAIAANE